MKKYLAFWNRGWWAWLFMLCANVLSVLLALPFAFLAKNNVGLYWFSTVIALLVIGMPLIGWIFEKFAVNSARLIQTKEPSNVA
jgi:hypothetical protein